MKRIAIILLIASLFVSVLCIAKPKRVFHKVVYVTSLDCEKCAEKIRENIAFEKGVQDLAVDVEKKTVEVKYDEAKNDTLSLRKAINKLGYEASVISFE